MKTPLKWNVVSGVGLYAVNILVAFFMAPFLVRTLGNLNYGLWDIVIGFIGYMGLLDLGMGPAVVRYVSAAEAENDRDKLNAIVSSAFFFFLCVGLVAFLIIWGFSFAPEILFGAQVNKFPAAGMVLIIVSINLLMQFPGTVFVGTLLGYQKHFLVNTIQMSLTVIKALLVVTILPSASSGLVVLAGVETAGLLIQYSVIAGLFIFSSELPRPTFSQFSWKVVKELCWFGLKNSILMLASRLQKQSIPIIIGRVIGFNSVIFFSLPNRLVEYGKGLTLAMGTPLMPYFGSLSQSSDLETMRSNWKKLSLAMQSFAIVMPLFLWFVGDDFLRLWIGPEYSVKGQWVLRILVIGLAAEAVSPIAGRLLVGLGKHGRAAKVWLVVSLIFVPVAVISAYLAGLEGLATASVVATVTGSFLVLRLTCLELRMTVWTHVTTTVLPLIPALFVSAVILFISGRIFYINSYLDFALVVISGILPYIFIIWLTIKKKIY
jgi:O-antigen/teichoic acid export membrane protein